MSALRPNADVAITSWCHPRCHPFRPKALPESYERLWAKYASSRARGLHILTSLKLPFSDGASSDRIDARGAHKDRYARLGQATRALLVEGDRAHMSEFKQ
jgi:hypothetical protein